MTWTTPRTWVAGETVTAAMLNAQVRDNLNVISPLGDITQLTQYTPSFASTGTAPSLGAGGTAVGAWARIGGMATGNVLLTFGTSPAAGTGAYLIGLPTPASASQPLGVVGNGVFADASTTNTTAYAAQLLNSGQMAFRLGNTTNTQWASGAPVPLASGDTFSCNFSYWAA